MNNDVQIPVCASEGQSERLTGIQPELFHVILGGVAVPIVGRETGEDLRVWDPAGPQGTLQRAIIIAHPDYGRRET